MTETKRTPKITIISFSPIAKDGRVLRQIHWLKEFAELQVIGYDPMPVKSVVSDSGHPIRWVALPEDRYNAKTGDHQLRERILKWGPVFPALYPGYFKTLRCWQLARFETLAFEPDLVVSNELDPLPIAIEAKRTWKDTRVLLDMHEYSPDQYGKAKSEFWKIVRPRYRWMLKRLAPEANQIVTISSWVAKRLAKEFKLSKPKVVHNAPSLPVRRLTKLSESDGKIHLVHHGIASDRRGQDVLIEMMRKTKADAVLHFFLVDNAGYQPELEKMAADLGERVRFHDPVPTHLIAETVSQFDIGTFVLRPFSLNARWALPNKMFEFAAAGLPMLFSPTDGMKVWIEKYQAGWVAGDHTSDSMAAALDALTLDEIAEKRPGALKLSETVNADTERDVFLQVAGKALASRLYFKPRDGER